MTVSSRTIYTYTCERCGAKIDTGLSSAPVTWMQVAVRSSAAERRQCADLCPHCAASYHAWFRVLKTWVGGSTEGSE
jgi:hypothetical protein